MFIRSKVPMTKSEVRVITLAKARINIDHTIWDIGAGTGSISVEAAIAATDGKVYAVEREEDALELLKKNIESFGIDNVVINPGTAPEVLKSLPAPDRVIVGGSGGNLGEIISHSYDKMPPGGRIVINAVVLETLTDSAELLNKLGFREIEITQVSISKTAEVGKVHMLRSHNPVFVISGEK